jgi:beta-N-acetylhexosaminidase
MAMTAHILYPAWDPEYPATLSRTIIDDLIRGELGFDGLLMTDDIAMQALSGSLAGRAGAALAAGCDFVLHCSGEAADNEGLAGALGVAGEAATARLSRALAVEGAPADLAALLARRDALLALA